MITKPIGGSMTVVFDGKGFSAEKIAAKQFNGVLVDDLALQHKDIDLMVTGKDGEVKSVSVKDQTYSTKRGYTTIQVELELIDTDTGETMLGCFYSNASDYYFWRVWYEAEDTWLVVKSSTLKEFVQDNMDSLPEWKTTQNTNAKNREFGRKFNGSCGVTIEIDSLIEIGKSIPVRNREVQ